MRSVNYTRGSKQAQHDSRFYIECKTVWPESALLGDWLKTSCWIRDLPGTTIYPCAFKMTIGVDGFSKVYDLLISAIENQDDNMVISMYSAPELQFHGSHKMSW